MKVRGTVTRVVGPAAESGGPVQIFFRPDDPSVARRVDAAHLVASGELRTEVEGDDLKVGEQAEFEMRSLDGEEQTEEVIQAPAPAAETEEEETEEEEEEMGPAAE